MFKIVDNTTIKFNSLRSLIPKQSTVVKLIFSDNFLSIIFVGCVILSVSILFNSLISNSSNNKSNSNSGGDYGGSCAGGCGGCGVGGEILVQFRFLKLQK